MMQGIVFSISEASLHDGPGLRTAVFLKGCPMRCRWCHSPEGQEPQPQILHFPDGERYSGTAYDAESLAEYLRGNAELCPGGGITFSGGEPLMQPDFLLDVLARLKGIHTIVETAGCCSAEIFARMAKSCSLIFFGLKIIDDAQAKHWTGVGTGQILKNLRLLDDMSDAADYLFRIPLLAGIIDTESNMRDLMNLCQSLKRLQKIEFLPANPLAPAKYDACGRQMDTACVACQTGKIPLWFNPGVPWAILD